MRKVIYRGDASDDTVRWGGNDDPRGVLEPGKEYFLLVEEVHSWHTKYILAEHPTLKFNSVDFDG